MTTLMDPAFLCSEDGCLALVSEIPGYCPAHQGQPREYDFEPLPPSAGPATLVRRRARTCQAPKGDVPADAPLTARLCGRPATTSATVEGVTFDLCAACAQELTMTDLTDFARPDESCAAAIARAVREGRRLCSYESPTEEAREGLTASEAGKIASEDPSLVRVEGAEVRS